MFFLVNASAQDYLDCNEQTNTKKSLAFKKILAGGLAGQAFWLSGYPFDVIKSYMQYHPKEKGMIDTIKYLYGRNGVRYFYRGLSITLVRAFPVNAINFVAYEIVSKKLSN